MCDARPPHREWQPVGQSNVTDIAEYYETYWSDEGFYPHGGLGPELGDIFNAHITPGARCLDIGCGDGRTSGLWLRDRSCEYVGVDVSANAIRDAQALGLNAQQIDDSSKLPFDDDSFDAVVCIEVLEHLFLPQLTVTEAYRVLRPGGVFIATVPNVAYWRRRVDMALFGRWNPLGDELAVEQPWRDPHIRFFNPGSLRRLVSSTGFAPCLVNGHSGALLRDIPWIGARLKGRASSKVYRAIEARLPSLLGFRLHVVGFKPRPA